MKRIHDRKRQIAILLLSFLLIVTGTPVAVFADAGVVEAEGDTELSPGFGGGDTEPSPTSSN